VNGNRHLSDADRALLDAAGFTDSASPLPPINDQREEFDGDTRVPGLAQLLEFVPADWHPLSVHGFLHTPHPDIAIASTAATPLEWLRHSGGDIAPVVKLIEIAQWTGR
jgi:hypothetical protein